jgi:hypothetical protein
MKTGRVRWDVEVADYKTAHSITLAPLSIKDKVIIGDARLSGAEPFLLKLIAHCKRGSLPKDATKVDRMKRKLQTKVGKAIYAARKCVVEPVSSRSSKHAGLANSCYAEKRK